jgi:chloramphenicol O-acetyltransferase
MKRIREVVIHICMEISQRNSLCSYLYLKQAKTSFFKSFIFFSFTKSENRKEEYVLRGCWHQWEGGGGRERG